MFTFFTRIRCILLEFTLNSLCSERINYILTTNWISFWQIHYEFIIFLRINYKFFIFCAKRSIIAFTNSLLIHYFYAISSRIHFLFRIFTINLLPPLQILDAFIIIPREFTINSTAFFANSLCVYLFLREFSLNSSFPLKI